MSAKTELNRVAVRVPTALTQAKTELAEKAQRLLGYGLLVEEVKDAKVRQVFHELGVEPMDIDKVERYKAKRERGDAQWYKVELNQYRKEVPLFAISRATELKERLPEARFFVDELRYAPKDPDPFLVMYVGDNLYYLDVWDEPEFEGRRTV